MRIAKLRLYLALVVLPLQFCFTAAHPFYLSVCDLVYSAEQQSMQISVRIFTNDLEQALKKAEGKTVDLYHPKDSVLLDKQLNQYLQACLKINLNGKDQKLNYHGHEREGESCWLYLVINNCPKPEKMTVVNTLLYNSFLQQANIIQVEIAEIKKSARLAFPDSKIDFNF